MERSFRIEEVPPPLGRIPDDYPRWHLRIADETGAQVFGITLNDPEMRELRNAAVQALARQS